MTNYVSGQPHFEFQGQCDLKSKQNIYFLNFLSQCRKIGILRLKTPINKHLFDNARLKKDKKTTSSERI